MKTILFVVLFGVISLIPNKTFSKFKSIFAIIFISIIISYFLIESIFVPKQDVVVETFGEKNELSEGNEIWLKGVLIDGKYIEADEVFKGNWMTKDNSILIWRDYDVEKKLDSSVKGKVKKGDKIELVFDSNKWRGKAKIIINNEKTMLIDTFSNSEDGKDVYLKIPFLNESVEDGKTLSLNNKFVLFFINFIPIFIVLTFLEKIYEKNKFKNICYSKNKLSNRIVWIDLLRVVCIFTIVLLHSSCDLYYHFSDNINDWYSSLYINCFTAFAVPCFFMISGMLMINQNINLKKILHKSFLFFLSLLLWSIIYILFRKYMYGENIDIVKSMLQIPFSSQGPHLWFMYDLLSIYLLLPLINFVYYKNDKMMNRYLLFLIFAIPSLISTIENILSISMDLPLFSLMFPSLGVFLLGKIFYESKLKNKKVLFFLFILVGYSFMVVGNYIVSIKRGEPINAFIGNYGTIPVLMYSSGIFGLFLSFSDSIEKLSSKIKKIIYCISKNSMGIYFSHIIVKDMIGNITLGNIYISSNSGSNLNMILGAILYFMISLLFTNIVSKSQLFGKILCNVD